MSASKVATRGPSLIVLRAVAAVGIALAVAVVAVAFSRGVVPGLVSLAIAPVVPLTLVVVIDRLFRR